MKNVYVKRTKVVKMTRCEQQYHNVYVLLPLAKSFTFEKEDYY